MFDLWDINVGVLDLFLGVQSQWRCIAVAGFGGGTMIWQGLDYAGVDAFMRRARITDENGELFDGLLVMEAAALLAFAGGAA